MSAIRLLAAIVSVGSKAFLFCLEMFFCSLTLWGMRPSVVMSRVWRYVLRKFLVDLFLMSILIL